MKNNTKVFIPFPPSPEYAEGHYRYSILLFHSVFIYFHLFFLFMLLLSGNGFYVEALVISFVAHFGVVYLKKTAINQDRKSNSTGFTFIGANDKDLFINIYNKNLEGPAYISKLHSEYLENDLYDFSYLDMLLLKRKAKRIHISSIFRQFEEKVEINLDDIDWENSLKEKSGFKTIVSYDKTKTIIIHPVFSDETIAQIKEACTN